MLKLSLKNPIILGISFNSQHSNDDELILDSKLEKLSKIVRMCKIVFPGRTFNVSQSNR